MPLTPFNAADPSNILTALYRDLAPEQVVSLQFNCEELSAWQGQDDWILIQQVLRMLYHGPVRVPAEARPCKAIVRVEFPKGSSYRSVPTDIDVELVKLTKE